MSNFNVCIWVAMNSFKCCLGDISFYGLSSILDTAFENLYILQKDESAPPITDDYWIGKESNHFDVEEANICF